MFSNEIFKGGEKVFDVSSDDPLRYLDNFFFNSILLIMEVLAFTGGIINKGSMILLKEV